VVNGRQFTLKGTAGVLRDLGDQYIAGRNGKPPSSTKPFVRIVCEIEHHEVVSTGIVADESPDKHPHEWTKQTLISLEEAMEAYTVEVIAASHC